MNSYENFYNHLMVDRLQTNFAKLLRTIDASCETSQENLNACLFGLIHDFKKSKL